jgi:ABC-type multidrug transport system ATPase subunit
MNESILKALMQLFALVVDIQGNESITKESRDIVANYLKSLLNKYLAEQYLEYFDKYVIELYGNNEVVDTKKIRKKVSLKAVKVLKICDQINLELTQEQKFIVLIQLLEFICMSKEIEEIELEFLQMVSDSFNIDEKEYLICKSFIINSGNELIDNENCLIISELNIKSNQISKSVVNQDIDGKIIVIRVSSINSYFFKYIGNDIIYLNNQVVSPNKSYLLGNGSSIKSTKISTIYYTDVVSYFLQSTDAVKLSFIAENVEFTFPKSINGIHNFNFSENACKLVGVMGGSGVGKSTLLNILNGNLKPQKGEIYINGFDIYKEKDKIEGVIGFVPQDDLLIEELTVYQNLYYNTKLCFSKYSENDIHTAVIKALEQLELLPIKDLTVGNSLNKFISGGQRKRLNIALELIRQPTVLFVDEPTSGLSSMDSQMVMDLLKELTLSGKLVIVNIHQPSSEIYKMFDKLLIIDKGGFLVYYGNPIDALIYFKKQANYANANESGCDKCGNINPEQVLEILEAKVINEYGKQTKTRKISPEEWNEKYENLRSSNLENTIRLQEELPKTEFNIPGILQQFKIFVTRDILTKLTNRQYLIISFLEAPLLAFILGYFTKYISGNKYIFSENENLPSYLFMSVVVALFLGLTLAAEEIIKDRRIRKREEFLNLSNFSYINSKVFVMFLMSSIQTLTFVLLGNAILGIKDMTFSYWLVLFTASCFSNLLGLLISSALNSVVTIYILIPFILVPQLLFSGVIVKFDKLHKVIASDEYVSVLGDVMISRWAYEAIAVEQFTKNKYQKPIFETERKMSRLSYFYSYLIPELQNKLNDNYSAINNLKYNNENNDNFKILENNIHILSNYNNLTRFENLNKLNKDGFNNVIYLKTAEYLENMLDYFREKYDNEVKKRDQIIISLDSKYKEKGGIDWLKKTYFNTSLDDLMRNKLESDKIIEKNGKLIQQIDPIYKKPTSNLGRAHFYSAYKIFCGYKIDTFIFNLLLIWIVSFFVYLMLLFDGLKKIINFIGGNFKH